MPITNENIEDLLIRPALTKLIEKDIILIDKAVKVECISHKLAIYLSEILLNIPNEFQYDIDLEYNKRLDGEKDVYIDNKHVLIRPDILVHERGTLTHNLLAIETKKYYTSKHDRNKICGLMNNNYNYTFGCLISYLPRNTNYVRYVLFTKNGGRISRKVGYVSKSQHVR